MEIQIIFWDSVVEVQIIFGQCSGDYFWDSVVEIKILWGQCNGDLNNFWDSVVLNTPNHDQCT